MWRCPSHGIVGGRLYHVITTPAALLGRTATRCGRCTSGRAAWASGAPSPWAGWAPGSPAGAAASRCRSSPPRPRPRLLVAQAVGRLGNWFNQELFGRPTDLPWGLEIAPQFRPAGFEQFATFQPTFLYELLWNLAAAAVVVWADRRFQLSHGRAFALYVALYCLGRGWIEMLRIDTAEHFLGLRLNVFTSVLVGVAAVAYLVLHAGPPREHLTRVPTPRPRSRPPPPRPPVTADDDRPDAEEGGDQREPRFRRRRRPADPQSATTPEGDVRLTRRACRPGVGSVYSRRAATRRSRVADERRNRASDAPRHDSPRAAPGRAAPRGPATPAQSSTHRTTR